MTGFELTMPEADYRKAEGVNYSRLKRLAKSPAHVHVEFHPTPAMSLGNLVDNLICTGDYGDGYVVKSWDGRTKEGRELAARAKEEKVTVVEQEMADKARRMADNVLNHSDAAGILGKCRKQVPAFAECPETGLPLKCLFDFIDLDSNLQGDLKTTSCDLSEASNWEREVINRDYHIQMAHYLGIRHLIEDDTSNTDWYWICVESTDPFGVRVFQADNALRSYSHYKWRDLLRQWDEVSRAKLWDRGYPEIIETIGLPAWVK